MVREIAADKGRIQRLWESRNQGSLLVGWALLLSVREFELRVLLGNAHSRESWLAIVSEHSSQVDKTETGRKCFPTHRLPQHLDTPADQVRSGRQYWRADRSQIVLSHPPGISGSSLFSLFRSEI